MRKDPSLRIKKDPLLRKEDPSLRIKEDLSLRKEDPSLRIKDVDCAMYQSIHVYVSMPYVSTHRCPIKQYYTDL